ncbi:signal recognition particle-docking protein FtsY [Mycolicibacterium sphagni]|uniref:Signal recognition particle receptor FtsY n=1 Tax=Mycolicibacterium sphagni TaxID=1786 RepID=A0A255DY66_9MYCO|nr:signal recognition particle-docking protein FtsY [Mycolicibacterium sphagni]MCV7179126.1 signal recognition particle-docking protein FtsY [Mycolicibacterium sphagni]OYN82225.1 signal recognition particle-docking protein FtsY [Mycolicibacterium sphagni]
MSEGLWIAIAVIAVLVIAALVVGLVRFRRRQISLRPGSESPTPIDRSGGYSASSGITFTQSPTVDASGGRERGDSGIGTGLPGVGDDAAVPRDSVKRPIADVRLPEPPVVIEEPAAEEPAAEEPITPPEAPAPEAPDVEVVAPAAPDIEAIAPAEGRLERLRGRLAKSQNALGRSMLGLLGGGDLDEASWEEVEDTLLIADLGPVVTASVMEQLRSRLASSTVRTEADARAVLRDVLITELNPALDRSIKALPHANKPSVLLVVGVNGTGKTTTVGKLARVLVADGRRVVLGAADTFRAAAADQLQSWGSRVGAEVIRGAEGADPASVAFDAVDKGIEAGADVVVIDTAGRLHTKTGLMDELGKVKRVVSKRAAVDEVLLVLDATIGQNGLAQARVFADVVDITGVVLTKLDGTAKGGIVFRVQQELGVPVKLVGLGEGPDDLAPFEADAFVDALLG